MIPFYKFQGTGNDFILLDGFTTMPVLIPSKIRDACNRNFGIGADGLILVSPSDIFDFEMIFFNPDGTKAPMCGNGARCAVAFAKMLGIASENITFIAGDGVHQATVIKSNEAEWYVEVSIPDVSFPVKYEDGYYINTGTHHFVRIVDSTLKVDVHTEGPKYRNDQRFKPEGVNVNWVSIKPGLMVVRTFEKGVENETLSCGTGVTASALVAGSLTYDPIWKVETKGGKLEVSFKINDEYFSDIMLKGPAKLVFTGESALL
jgi:diaminopimelate epimerase